MNQKRHVILVTDGDLAARRALETAAKNIGARCISMSAGNPTRLNGQQLLELIKAAPHDPVIVMFDDKGVAGEGQGEKALLEIYNCPDINVLGVLAVASNSHCHEAARVDVSVTAAGEVVQEAVTKEGKATRGKELQGDTVGIINRLAFPVVVGVGDVGKMLGADDYHMGAPVTTKALQEIIKRSGFKWQQP
ncbi:stage V sporulation protein AE [Desulforamulus hydrothermalis]|uniref:stage V sporulation protein AE n=1 Tax=Desulforamulus hydrothermalis TaxID=412895 RepID=UPI0002D2FC9F|nr:stage V sporulation protein AE [Desulforamulus hydrothermalis]